MSAHLKILYNYIASHVSITEDIRDIVQETMLAVWQGIKKYNCNSAFRTWVIGITRRKIADYYRIHYKNTSIPFSEIEDFLILENEYESIENSIAVEEAITSLNKIEKELVFLVFNAQLSYTEISGITNIPVGTIKSRMASIKSKLAEQLGMEGEKSD